ncbi:hypothetical protein A4H97_08735 [Niastella yeongjuensis]|uniref:DUF3823 domain-containing protein n=1 Tax=Niastella yeongjuensis TaxID=354355 RepID=A0A1V9EER6_9BACT|nr:DUF3823 domain-containing protein [Niastella yeongjuensis]OQP44454.1 hypothetical protein A4H97_08735 [Niastella yeongjuensis]SEO87133.1 Protein of unknown function [Niastella yeongjuensis]
MKLQLRTILLTAGMLMAAASCVKKDNFDAPEASLEGNLVDQGSKNNIQTATGNVTIRLEQLSWSATPAPQDIPVKMDGSFKNSKLFKGHYRVSIKGGAFWAVPPVEMDIDKGSKYDFNLTPYLYLNSFTHQLDSNQLTLRFTMQAPIAGMPAIAEIQPYVNTTSLVGPGASIRDYSDVYKVAVNKEWADMSPADKSPEFVIPNLVRGRTFYVRVGVRFNNDDKSSNLSEIIKIDIPK